VHHHHHHHVHRVLHHVWAHALRHLHRGALGLRGDQIGALERAAPAIVAALGTTQNRLESRRPKGRQQAYNIYDSPTTSATQWDLKHICGT
jgi:hypothetical protein